MDSVPDRDPAGYSIPSIPAVDRPVHHELHHELLRFYAAHPIAHTSSIEVRVSHHIIQLIDQPCQLGVFATKSIKAGEDICYYASHLLHLAAARSVKPDQKAYMRQAPDTGGWVLDGAPTSKLFKRPIPKSANGIVQLKALKASELIVGRLHKKYVPKETLELLTKLVPTPGKFRSHAGHPDFFQIRLESI